MMDFARQSWTLTLKNLLIVFVRHWFATTFRALVLPIVFVRAIPKCVADNLR